jgi:FkbM family methyltransferase
MDIFSRYKAVIENTDNPVVLEIGAAEGEDTVRYVEALIALKRPFRYIAFEPDERNIWHLQRLMDKMEGRFDLVPYAVGDRSGVAPWKSSNHPYSGSVKEPKEHLTLYPHITFGERDSVGMVTLDESARGAKIEKVDWIWCDVQGAEDLVIAGGQETFKRTRFFYTEYLECEAYQGQIGRDEIHHRLPGNWVIAEDYRSWEKGGDCLFENLTGR